MVITARVDGKVIGQWQHLGPKQVTFHEFAKFVVEQVQQLSGVVLMLISEDNVSEVFLAWRDDGKDD